MAAIKNEIYVSIDALEYTKLDLYGDEAINLKYIKKDLQDLSKIFAPFSQGFQFPATPKNRAALGFFGDTDVIKINTGRKYFSKLYSGGILKDTGFLVLEGLTYKNEKPEDFSGSFASNMVNLKDKIGDDYLKDITDEAVGINWDHVEIQKLITSQKTITAGGVNVKYFVPLISNSRVWGYDIAASSTLLDNIAYKPTTNLASKRLIQPDELRPVIYLSAILDFIKLKYDLNLIIPLENREEFNKAVVFCNAETLTNEEFSVLPILKNFGAISLYDGINTSYIDTIQKYLVTNTANNTINIYKNPAATDPAFLENGVRFSINFNSIVVTADSLNTPSVDIQYIRTSDDTVIKTANFEINGTFVNCETILEDVLFSGDNLNFYVKIKFSQPTNWASCDFRVYWNYYNTQIFTKNLPNGRTQIGMIRQARYYQDSKINNNSALIESYKIDLIKSLPKVKVADFLSSFFKTFNISVLDSGVNSTALYWLTPEDINSVNNVYSKAVVDYTQYADFKSRIKEVPNEYNYYNFKHATSSYFSNVKYFETFGVEYGQATYPATKPADANEFIIETIFSIIPPVTIEGAGVLTAYGFTDDAPELLETGESRYSPNYDELTLFYVNGAAICPPLGINGYVLKSITTAPGYKEERGAGQLTGYIKVSPVSNNGYSLGFSVLNYNDTDYTNTLYLRYYADQTIRFLDPNVLAQTFNLILPPSEIYLNDNAAAGGLNVPSGFRLQNDVIIKENLFTIIEASIDITTGKTKLKLLNY